MEGDDGPPEEGVPPEPPSFEGEMTVVRTMRNKKRDFKLHGAELAWFDDGDKEDSISMFDVSIARPSEDSDADDSDHEIEVVTEEKTWRFRAEDEDEKAKWLEVVNQSVAAAQATQGISPEQRLEEAGMVYRLPDYGVTWIGEPPRKSRESSPPIKAKPMQDYGLHGSVRKLKICMGWWLKGHKPWKEQSACHAGAALLNAAGEMVDFVSHEKHKSECGAVEWDPNSPPHKPHEVEVGDPPEGCEDPEGWAEEEKARQKAIRKHQKRVAKHWAKKGDDEALKVKFHKLNPEVHFIVPVVSVLKPKYAWHLDRKKSVRKLKMRLVHGTKESRYAHTHIPHDEEGRAAMLLMDLNKLDQDLDSTASSSSASSDSEGDDAGCESYIMGVLARKGSFWTCRTAGIAVGGRSVQAVCADPAIVAPCLIGLQPTWNETQFRSVQVQVLGARNVLARDGDTSDPYAKIKYKKINTIRSETIKKTLNPEWELPMVEMGTVDAAGYKAFMIKLWDDDRLGDDFIGALKLRPGMFFGGIAPGEHVRCFCPVHQKPDQLRCLCACVRPAQDLWLPLAPDREHPKVKVKGELHVRVIIEDTSTGDVAEATVWQLDEAAVAEATAELPIVVAEATAA